MDTSYAFNFKRRLRGAAPALAIAAGLGVLLTLFGPFGTWRFWVVAALIAVMLWRAASYLWFGRNEVELDAEGLSRSGHKVRYHGAELELRCLKKGERLQLSEVVLWEPMTDQGRNGVGFDDSLDRFEQAVKAIVARVPELRIKVTTVSDKDVQGEAREAVLAPLRPTAAERALADLGRNALSIPPHLRS